MTDPEVLKVFIDETNEILAGLEKAIAEQNLEPIHRLAHTLKGNAAQFGFPDPSQAAKEIEFLARDILHKEKELDAENIALFNKQIGRLKDLCQTIKS
jgi:HPt (histidine-containing phosphotransfer) domain-containing protein